MPHTATLSLGSNIEPRQTYLKDGFDHIGSTCGEVLAVSDIFETEPWGFNCPDAFLNCVVLLNTSLQPIELLENLMRIEEAHGRHRDSAGYASRTLDIDILFYDSLILYTKELVLPHPRIHLRKFVLKPLQQLMPNHIHPVFHKPVFMLLDECLDGTDVKFFGSSHLLSGGIG
jgi:deoxyguanosine kinase